MKNGLLLLVVKPLQLSEAIILGVYCKACLSALNIQPHQFTQYLTRQQVALLLNADLKTVYNWTKQRKLKPYRYAHRVFYKRHEIIQSLNSNQL